MKFATITLGVLIAFASGVVVGMLLPRPGSDAPSIAPRATDSTSDVPRLLDLGVLLESKFGWHFQIEGDTLLAGRDDAEEHLRFTRDGRAIRSVFYELAIDTWGRDDPAFLAQSELVALCGKTIDVPATVLALLINSATSQADGHDAIVIGDKLINASVVGDKLHLSITVRDTTERLNRR